MEDLLNLINPNNYNENEVYVYNGVAVPRVTSILSSMLHEDYLMKWSNSIGLYNHQKYEDVLGKSADIGSYVHDAIEKYLSENIMFDENNYPIDIRYQVKTAFYSFLEWWEIIKKNDYEILMQETALVCKYFGGTLDLLIKINGKTYLVDFKTSNHPSYKYFLQLSAYIYMLKEIHGIDTDGCIILMLSKKTCKFTEFVLDFMNHIHLEYINMCKNTFISLVYAYYNRIMSQKMYKDIFGGLNGRNRNVKEN